MESGQWRARHYGRQVSPDSISWVYWFWFCVFVVGALAVDLGLLHRHGRETTYREALGWTGVWVASAMAFGLWVAPNMVSGWTSTDSGLFLTGYLVELSLSMDNVFVIALIFNYFKVPKAWQHRVLFWGIIGALLFRGLMIYGGSELIRRFHWLLYLMGAFLLVTGVRMLWSSESAEGESVDLSKNWVVRLARRLLPITSNFEGERFLVSVGGRRRLTPLALVLLVVETTDVVFAVDSIPAIFGITQKPFLIFTSNVFAILGLRSLYFVLARAMGYFRYLKAGLALVLVVIGIKMLAEHWLSQWLGDRLMTVSLSAVIGIIGLAVVSSLYVAWTERGRGVSGD